MNYLFSLIVNPLYSIDHRLICNNAMMQKKYHTKKAGYLARLTQYMALFQKYEVFSLSYSDMP